ncbi:MAG: aspartate--tRNA ligase [Clostridia bacterium]|nr:aspartate--tRNA ligase [Oscillospiraceae bacterium]MBQ7960690.1 aspartate--tRNA ligase [Clostridia bacterium]
MLRTHTCNELNTEHIGKNVVLTGWIETIRDHGGVLFVDLRDHYGVTQIVFSDDSLLAGMSKETVVLVEGTVTERDAETVNHKLATGLVEVRAEKIEVLGPCQLGLPFEIDASTLTREEVRLKYRYLDLRNRKIHDNIVLRSKILSYLRSQMEDLGFMEIQTPILTASSPEGARDYLVPSRKHKGKFYALPQAPQQFKQLLMASGFDRYFQIAPCFRDEDARQDRSPGEFYQLDFEMSFATQEDVFEVAETVIYNTFTKFSDKKVSKPPFRRITFADAMMKYGSDKPDLRNPLIIQDLTEFFAKHEFLNINGRTVPFKNKLVRGIVANYLVKKDGDGDGKKAFEKAIDAYSRSIGMKFGIGYITLEDGEYKGPIAKFLSEEQKAELTELVGIKEGESLFFISDSAAVIDRLSGEMRTWIGNELGLIKDDSFEFCFIVDFPMYELNPETNKIDFTHNPFSMPQGGMDALLNKDPLEIFAYQYDIVCNGVELSSGAVRNHNPEIMRKAFEIAGYGEEDLKAKFGALYTAFAYGAPPHAGMAPGVDRMIMLIAGEETIRDVIAFPLNGNAQDLMMGAPGEVTEQQLREVHIKVRD